MKKRNLKSILLLIIVFVMINFLTPDYANTKTKLTKEASHPKKFIIYNYRGSIGGSFIISILQQTGVPCADELFNKDGIYPGSKFLKVFADKKLLYSKKPSSVKEAFELLQKCEPINQRYLGLKICGSQQKRVGDFYDVLENEDIIKIFLYRKDEIKLYLTRYFFYKLRRGDTRGFDAFFYDPEPFKYVEYLKKRCKGEVVEVESEDIFDFHRNSFTKLCQVLDINETKLKNLAVKAIEKSPVISLDQVMTKWELEAMKDFFKNKYTLEELSAKKYIDCRKVSITLGFH